MIRNSAFQFHTGSIKSQTTQMRDAAQKVFQFHTGSIKSNNDEF